MNNSRTIIKACTIIAYAAFVVYILILLAIFTNPNSTCYLPNGGDYQGDILKGKVAVFSFYWGLVTSIFFPFILIDLYKRKKMSRVFFISSFIVSVLPAGFGYLVSLFIPLSGCSW